jgi:hypothetical protein
MPEGAEILHVDAQRNIPCIWAKVDTDRPAQIRKFRLVGTGHPLDREVAASMFHHGSFFMEDGIFVFHLFEVTQ